jgi:RNA polymerase sigma factor (sigma-70 family)
LEDSDVDLLPLVRKGDLHAFTAIYRRYGSRVLRYLMVHTLDEASVEDLLQQTFFTAWSKHGQARIVGSSMLPWLLVIARNHSANEYRRLLREKFRTQNVQPDSQSLIPFEQRLWIEMELDKLSPVDQEVCRLCLVEGYSYAEAAEMLGVTSSTIGKRLERAKARLRAAFRSEPMEEVN